MARGRLDGDGAWALPTRTAEETPDGLEEERRLCYVGLTRAKDKLYLSWARARRRGGELRPGIASRFLRDLPPGIIEEKRTTSLWAPDWSAGGRRSDTGFGWRDRGGVGHAECDVGPLVRPDGARRGVAGLAAVCEG